MADRPTTSEPTKLSNRSWRDDVSSGWRRFAANVTRESVISNLKTLAWVVPLTLLIWIWAEREQVQPAKDVVVPFELTSADANRVVTLKPPQDTNLVLELSGPQAQLQELLNRLHGGSMPQGLRLEVPTSYSPGQDYTVRTYDLVSNQRVFAQYGVTVSPTNVQPAKLEISVDELVDREAKIYVPPNLKNVDATFNPPTVKVRGPRILLNRAAVNPSAGEHGQLAVLAEGLPRTPGPFKVDDVVLAAPEELKDPADRVHINDAHVKVAATGTVSQAETSYKMSSMNVWPMKPPNTDDKFHIVMDLPAVQNVTIIGPPDLIDQVKNPAFDPQPKAVLVITAADLINPGEKHTKIVKYDLPFKELHVSPEDEKKTVDFKVIDASATPAS